MKRLIPVEIQAAVLYRKGEKSKIEPVALDGPKAEEVLVKMVAFRNLSYRYSCAKPGVLVSSSRCFGTRGSNQHRGSYHKAAGLLVAMAETLANRGKKQEGIDLIERYRNKYPRHTAFKSEVTQAVQTSGLFDVSAFRKGR